MWKYGEIETDCNQFTYLLTISTGSGVVPFDSAQGSTFDSAQGTHLRLRSG